VSDPTPLVTASRDALAEGLRTAGVEVGSVGGQAFREHVADALLASGVVRAVDGLAEDEALVERVAGARIGEAWGASARRQEATSYLRALAAALATPTDPSEA